MGIKIFRAALIRFGFVREFKGNRSHEFEHVCFVHMRLPSTIIGSPRPPLRHGATTALLKTATAPPRREQPRGDLVSSRWRDLARCSLRPAVTCLGVTGARAAVNAS